MSSFFPYCDSFLCYSFNSSSTTQLTRSMRYFLPNLARKLSMFSGSFKQIS